MITIARNTQMGTPSDMSPEQVRGASDVDARHRHWALGASLYEMLAGRVPFRAESYGALMIAIAIEPCPALDVLVPETPLELASVVRRALEKHPAPASRRGQPYGPSRQRAAQFFSHGAPDLAPGSEGPGAPVDPRIGACSAPDRRRLRDLM